MGEVAWRPLFLFLIIWGGVVGVWGILVFLRMVVAGCRAYGFWLTRYSWAAALG